MVSGSRSGRITLQKQHRRLDEGSWSVKNVVSLLPFPTFFLYPTLLWNNGSGLHPYLAMLCQHLRSDFRVLLNQLKDRVG